MNSALRVFAKTPGFALVIGATGPTPRGGRPPAARSALDPMSALRNA
jgi:hypothetical protein